MKRKTSLVILVGGRGSRISKYSKGVPKPLTKFNKVTFLDLLLNYYCKFEFKEVILLSGYKSHLFKKKYHNKMKNLIKIRVLEELNPLGTGGALRNIKQIIKNDFILMNGDSYFEINLNEINYKLDKPAHIFLIKNKNYKSNQKLSNLNCDKKNLIHLSKKNNYMNSGIYYFKKEIFKFFPNKKIFSLENELLENLINKKKVSGTVQNGFFLDIGTPQNLKFGKKNIRKILNKPALFLDRDGVINIDKGYTHKIKDFKLMPNILKILKYINKKKFNIFIVTNQAGIAKKKFTINEFYKFQNHLKNYFIKHNVYINDLRYCFFHPNSKIKKFKKRSNFRKPGNLMIESLFREWFIDRKNSLMIGDKKKDFDAAKKSKIKFIYYSKNLFYEIKSKIK